VTAQPRDLTRFETLRFWAAPGARVEVALRALGTARIEVALVDADGEAVVGGRLQAVAAGADPDEGAERLPGEVGEPRGRYLVPVPGPGTYRVQAAGPDLAVSEPVEVEIPAGQRSAFLRIALEDEVSLRGRLVSPSGVPLADLAVAARIDRIALPWPMDPGERTPARIVRARSDHDGTFELVGLHPRFRYELLGEREQGTFVIAERIAADGASGRDFPVAADRLGGAVAHLEIAAPARASAPRALRCDLWELRADLWSRTRDDQELEVRGRTATLEGLDAGRTYALVLRADGCAPAVHGPWTCRRFADSIDVALVEPATLAVTVLAPDGTPQAGARVWVARSGAQPFEIGPTVAHTDALGVAVLRDLRAGPHRLQAGTDLLSSDAVDLELRAGARHEAALRLR
jgi:hypothetical protein